MIAYHDLNGLVRPAAQPLPAGRRSDQSRRHVRLTQDGREARKPPYGFQFCGDPWPCQALRGGDESC
jgi:hypothetical protein